MLGFFKTYEDEYNELFEYLVYEWCFKPEYATAFLDIQKKKVGKTLYKLKKIHPQLQNSNNPETALISLMHCGEECKQALAAAGYYTYMLKLRRGKYLGTPVEYATWAIIMEGVDIIESFDRAFALYIEDKSNDKFELIFDEVYDTAAYLERFPHFVFNGDMDI
ncbi:MAG TPA: hypothetical protein ENK05_08740 [Gammaproteobacteria bacterium]|nr:hypothetical protein [Gammaproteobacteria bacterium]